MNGAAETQKPHIPVMLDEVLDVLQPRKGGVYVDGTFGAGGYTSAILEAADCAVLAIDRDPNAVLRGRALETKFAGRLTLIEGCFGDMQRLVSALGHEAVDGVVLDVGVSSMQLDEAARGFSFQKDGPLDMRMSGAGVSAADVVNTFEESEIARIIAVYGEEKRARAVARAIVKARDEAELNRTLELANLVERVLGRNPARAQIHPATRTFQALRVFVNDELNELARGLSGAEALLREGGRFACVSFHSLEDRIVKKFLTTRMGREARASRYMPEVAEVTPSFREVNFKPRKARQSEIDINPRSRSAKLRAAERTAAPIIPLDLAALGLGRVPSHEGVRA